MNNTIKTLYIQGLHKIASTFRVTYNSIINYLYPYTCLNCNNLVAENNNFCYKCFNKLNFITTPFCQKCGKLLQVKFSNNFICGSCAINPKIYFISRSLLKFDENSKNLIHRFKYYDRNSYAKIFAKLAKHRYFIELQDAEIIVPVPMNRLKRLIRMYNHAQIFAQEVAKVFETSCIPDLLIKTKWTKSQTFLGKKEREKNLTSSLKYNKKYIIRNKNILLYLKHLYYGTAKKASITSDNLSSKVILSFIHLFIFAQNFSIGFKSGL